MVLTYDLLENGHIDDVCFLIIKITISSIVIGLKNPYFPLIHLPSCYRTVFIGQFVIGQFVIGQFSKLVTFKVLKKLLIVNQILLISTLGNV